MRYNFIMRFPIFTACFLACISASSQASWQNFGSFDAADFYNAHLGLVCIGGGHGPVERVVDGAFTGVLAMGVTQIAIQDSGRAWATDGDSLYLGTNAWTSWRATLGQPFITLVRATPQALFIYSDSDLYRTAGDTMLTLVQGIPHGDSITAMDYFSASWLIAVSSTNIYLSTDSGANWTLVLGKMNGSASVFADTEHHLVFTGGDNLRESTDSGWTWSVIAPPPEFDFGNFGGQVFGAHDCSGTFYITNSITNGSNSDIMRSQDGGITFESVGPSPLFQTSTGNAWIFDRGSTVFWKARYYQTGLDIYVSYDGVDGLIPDSVGSAITVTTDTVFDTMCAEASVPFDISVASSICMGVRIDSVSVLHANGIIAKSIVPQTLFGGGAAFSLSYSGTTPGTDFVMLRLLFHSLEWGFKEHVDFPILAYSVSSPAKLISTDSLQFGDVPLDTSERRSFQITNSGCSLLQIDSLVSSNPAVFSLPSLKFPFNMKRDSTANIFVTFSPRTIGVALESLELGTNAGHEFIELEGQGVKVTDAVDDESVKRTGIEIYPNPATTIFYVHGANVGASYALIDVLGRIAQRGFLEGQTISVLSLPEGMYLLKCGANTERVIISPK